MGGLGFRDLTSFNLAMLAKQGWRLIQQQDSLMAKCFKARYFPRSHLLDASASPNCSYVWKSIMAAIPILKSGCCWRVGDGSNIRVFMDKWIPNYPTNGVLHPARMEEGGWFVSDLINQEQKMWYSEIIRANFHKEDADAILKIPLSHRQASDMILWLHTKKGVYSVKSGYHVARQLKKMESWAEASAGPIGVQVWSKLWMLNVPKKIKVFGWRACQNILPTRANLRRRKVMDEDVCMLCSREAETGVHALWDCAVARDV